MADNDAGLNPDDEFRNNVQILLDGAGQLQPRKLSDRTAQGAGGSVEAFKAREEQLFRAAQRVAKAAGETSLNVTDDLKRLSALNLPESVKRAIAPLTAKYNALKTPPAAAAVAPPKTLTGLRDTMAEKMAKK